MNHRELPIIFTAESVRAILASRKTQTRRVVSPDVPKEGRLESVDHGRSQDFRFYGDNGIGWRRSRYRVGDVLWVKESWKTEELEEMEEDTELPPGTDGIRFRADGAFRPIENTQAASDAWIAVHRRASAWRSPLYMPRWASRISLEVTEVRAQRVQDISEEDAIAEGYAGSEVETPREQFAAAWDRINGKRSPFAKNDWVFAYTFRSKA